MRMKSKSLRTILLVTAAIAASGCSIINKSKPKTPVLGERTPVLTSELGVEVDPATAALPMNLPAAVANTEWAQSGGNAQKSMGHLALGSALGQAWAVSIGSGSTTSARLASAPVVSGGKVFTIDTNSTVRAFDATTGAM